MEVYFPSTAGKVVIWHVSLSYGEVTHQAEGVIESVAMLVFGAVFVVVALVSSRWTPLVGIGGLLALIGAARLLLP